MFCFATDEGFNSRLCWPYSGYEVPRKSNAEMLGLGCKVMDVRYMLFFSLTMAVHEMVRYGVWRKMCDIQAVEDWKEGLSSGL
jgi:hypothetical protein